LSAEPFQFRAAKLRHLADPETKLENPINEAKVQPPVREPMYK